MRGAEEIQVVDPTIDIGAGVLANVGTKSTGLQWNPAITKCHGTEKNVRSSWVFVITNYLVNNKNVRYRGVTKLNNWIYTTQNSLQTYT